MLRRVSSTTPRTLAFNALTHAARRSVSAEEQAEIDREAKLRNDMIKKRKEANQGGFFAKMNQLYAEAQQNAARQAGQAAGQSGTPGAGSNPFAGSGGAWGNTGPGGTGQRTFAQTLYAALLYSTAFYMIITVWQLKKPGGAAMFMQGVPRFAAPTEATVCYLAVRVLLSTSKQRELQDGFESFKQQYPRNSFYEYLMMMHPNALAGNTTSQQDFIHALIAIANAKGTSADWTSVITRVSRWGDDKSRVDQAMDNLRREYAGLIPPSPGQPGFGAGPASSFGGFGGVPQGQQAMGYGSFNTPQYHQGPQFGQFAPPQQQQQQQQPSQGSGNDGQPSSA